MHIIQSPRAGPFKTTAWDNHRALAEQVLLLSQKAAAERRLEIAAQLSDLALAEAGKAREPKLRARALALQKASKQALTQFREYEAAKGELQHEPGNAEASLAAGRYECLVWGEWESGLKKLAAGSDASLRELASKDLAAPQDADDQAAVGDGWFDIAKEKAGAEQANLYGRAAWWYEKALPRATGLLKSKLEKQLDKIKATAGKTAGP